ncbi:hypothetical protein [Marinibacterium sp. SX1]|uniref:hypothetical protein n=1 Tax=Marinibacterium sp. SX1 TaxID=3388424 RepID=UPI003D18084D
MSREIVLHIGRHKSGTSSLQHFLGSRRDYLDRLGVLYPRTGSANRIAHHAIADACNARKTGPEALAPIIEGIRAEMGPQHHMVLLSSEAFQNLDDLARLAALVEGLGIERIRIVCYVREHLDYAISGFRQMVQNQPGFMTFETYAKRFRDPEIFIARWQALGELTLKWYDREKLLNGDVIADFCALVGFEPGEIPDGDRNPSIGGNLLAYKMAANKLGLGTAGYDALRGLASDHAAFRSAFRIPDAAAEALRARSAYNARLTGLLGEIRMKSWADSPALPDVDRIDDDLELIGVAAADRPALAAEMRGAAAWVAIG